MSGMKRTIAILFGLLVVVFLISQLTTRNRMATEEGGGYVELVPPSLDVASIGKIRAWLGSEPDSVVELERSGDAWVVTSSWGWPANETTVTSFLSDISNLAGEKRSDDAAVLGDYQVDDESGLHVMAESAGGSEIFHFIVGKSARAGGFIRRADSDEVYLTPKSLRTTFGLYGDIANPPQSRRWIDLQVLKLERQDVDRIVIEDGGKKIVLEKAFELPEPVETAEGEEPMIAPAVDRTQWSWKPDAAGEFAKDKADRVLSALTSLYTQNPLDPDRAEEYGLDDKARVVEITTADGSTYRLLFGRENEDGSKVYFRREDGLPGEIHKGVVDRIFVSRKDLSPDGSS